jgi:hypothetical protein
MFYEIEAFTSIMTTGNLTAYEALKNLSYDVLTITESMRKENDILYADEQ